MHKVKTPKLPKEILPAFSLQDVHRLLDACRMSRSPSRDTAILLCLLDTGLRASELMALDVGHVDFETGAIQVKHGKGRQDRLVFLGARSLKALMKYLRTRPGARPEDPLWLSQNTGQRLTLWGLEHLCQRLKKRTGVAHCHPHTFRRTFALWSLRAGMDLMRLAAIMGHSDLSTLRRYLALVEQDLQDAHRQHGAVDKMLGG